MLRHHPRRSSLIGYFDPVADRIQDVAGHITAADDANFTAAHKVPPKSKS